MATLIALPSPVRDNLRRLAWRVRQIRALRGLGRTLALVALLLLVGFALDVFVGLPSLGRTLWLGLVAVTAGFGLAVGVVRPWLQQFDEADLAAVVEAHFPDLDERLLSSVELSRAERVASPELAQLLLDETAARTRAVSFASAVGSRGAWAWLTVAGLLVAGLALPSLLFPQAATRLWSRLLLPWQEPAIVADFRFVVEPGDITVARGRALSVRATLIPRDEFVRWPQQGTLVFTPAAAPALRQPLTPQEGQRGNFVATFLVSGPGDYHLEVGNAVSETFAVRTIDPVELVPESPQIVITPPDYARPTLDPVTVGGLGDLAILRGSRLEFVFQFTRPAVKAALRWTPQEGQPQILPLEPAPDRQTMVLRLTPKTEGTYRLLLEAEDGVRTPPDDETPFGGKITLREDQPPALASIKGAWNDRPIPVGERLRLEGKLTDDVALGGASLEYRPAKTAEKDARTEPITLRGAGQREAAFTHAFALAGHGKPGETLAYRLRYQDNRPAEFGGPNVRYYPESGWFSLRLVAQGESPRAEEIQAKRDALAKQIEAIKAALRAETRAADRLRAESRDEEELTPEQREQAAGVQEQNRKIQQQLEALAREAMAEPELQPLADAARELAATEMRQAGQELEKASAPRAAPMPREQAFKATEKELNAAYEKLEALAKKNDQLARDRLDQAKIEALAERQKALADEAEKLAAQKDNPMAQAEAERLRREQDKLAQELDALVQKSELLKKNLDAAQAEQVRREAEKAADLAKQQRELNAAIDEANKKAAQEKLAELADKQKELAARAEKLARETEKTLKADRGQPLPTKDAQEASDALKNGEGDKAAQAQDRAARDLDKLARDLQRLANLATDPREAAWQLARMQEELGNKLRDSKNLTPEQRADLAADQQAIREAFKNLSLPPARKDLAAQRDKTLDRLAEAEKKLTREDREAQAELDRARDEMRKLAGQMPTLSERQEQARRDLEKLARAQDELARRSDTDRHAAELAKKQADLAQKLAELDAPGQEARRDRIREQMAQAADDLKHRNGDDAKVAQKRAQQQMERLREALSGHKPADEKAAELAQRQRELAEQAEDASRDPKTPPSKLDALKQAQNKLSWETEALAAPEAPATKKDAARAVREAASKANAKEPTAEEARKTMEEAARKLDDLAQALGGKETESERAARLAKQQDRATQDAKDRPGTAQDQQRARDLAKELADLRGGKAQAEKDKARDALEKAAKADPKGRKEADAKARDALNDLAKKLADATPAPKDKQPKNGMPDKRSPLANKEMAQAARDLAKEQRDLREAVRKAMEGKDAPANPKSENAGKLGKLAAEQEAIRREASELSRNVGHEQGPQSAPGKQAAEAAKAGAEASKDLAAGAIEKGAQAGKTAEQALKELAKSLSETPRGKDGEGKDGKYDTLEQARKLAQRQETLNRELAPLSKDAGAARDQQMTRQSELEKQAAELAKRLQALGDKKGNDPQMGDLPRQGAEAARQAREAMKQAQEMGQSGNQPAAKTARQRAADALDRAATRAEQAGNNPSPDQGKAGQSLEQARGKMGDAKRQLGKGPSQPAANAMQEAGEQLRQAAEQLARSMQPNQPTPEGQPGPGGAPEGGIVDGKTPPRLPAGFDPRQWGQLPGELRTKIVQDARAKFGDDYARMIKLYFEQLADSPRKR